MHYILGTVHKKSFVKRRFHLWAHNLLGLAPTRFLLFEILSAMYCVPHTYLPTWADRRATYMFPLFDPASGDACTACTRPMPKSRTTKFRRVSLCVCKWNPGSTHFLPFAYKKAQFYLRIRGLAGPEALDLDRT
jgi:hypothetical protein